MMNQIDAFLLARTKLQSHRVRTAITIAIAGLLFGLIIAVITVAQGALASIDKYSSVGLNNRTIIGVSYTPQVSSFNEYEHMSDPDFVNEVDSAYKADIANKQVIAKKYSVTYDPSVSDPSPIGIDTITKQKVITSDGVSSVIVQRIANERREASGKHFSITDYIKSYESASLRGEFGSLQPTSGAITYMKNGKENQQVSSNSVQDGMIGNGSGVSLAILDETISEPFITNKDFESSKGEVPVIIPFSNAETLLGLSQLSKDASPAEQRERLQYVRTHIGDATASFCYRNDASRMLLGQAVAQQDELKKAAGNKDYIKPSVIYNAPDTSSCSAITIQSDTRSATVKQDDANRISFEKEAGIWQGDPIEHKVVVRGVGVSGDFNTGTSTLSITTLVNSLLNSNLGYGTWSIPAGLLAQIPKDSRPDTIFNAQSNSPDVYASTTVSKSYLVEFKDKDEARALLQRTGAYTGSSGDVSAYQFGSGTLFIDEARTWAEQALIWILIVVGLVAVIILWGIIGRTIADSRRESAVFRAIGATKIDIANIYGIYTLLISFRIVIFALILGLFIALIVDMLLSDTATLGAQLAYAAVDTNIMFHFFTPLSVYTLIVIAIIVLAGLLASIVPIILGARRNPIADMREDG